MTPEQGCQLSHLTWVLCAAKVACPKVSPKVMICVLFFSAWSNLLGCFSLEGVATLSLRVSTAVVAKAPREWRPPQRRFPTRHLDRGARSSVGNLSAFKVLLPPRVLVGGGGGGGGDGCTVVQSFLPPGPPGVARSWGGSRCGPSNPGKCGSV